jgi:O-antigen ligase
LRVQPRWHPVGSPFAAAPRKAAPPGAWARLLSQYAGPAALVWLALWLGMNTGPGVLYRAPSGLLGWAHFARTLFPLGVLVVSGIASLPFRTRILQTPTRLWLWYGVIGTVASMISPAPFEAAFWAGCYLAGFAAVRLYLLQPGGGTQALSRAVSLNKWTWVITSVFLTIMLVAARDQLFEGSGWERTGYSSYGRMSTIGDMPMSRASGMARFAAVPGILAFVLLFQDALWRRVLWATVFVGSAAMIYFMQSRGAIFAFAFSISFLMLLVGTRTRIVGFALLLGSGVILLGDMLPGEYTQRIMEHLRRGQDDTELRSLTGRTDTWAEAWAVFKDSPVLGWGFQADRLFLDQHVHNTYVYAALTAGAAGFATFTLGLLLAWRQFFRVLRSGVARRNGHWTSFITCGGILAFFTVRSVPEVSGSMFGIDFVVMLPILTYFGILAALCPGRPGLPPVSISRNAAVP